MECSTQQVAMNDGLSSLSKEPGLQLDYNIFLSDADDFIVPLISASSSLTQLFLNKTLKVSLAAGACTKGFTPA